MPAGDHFQTEAWFVVQQDLIRVARRHQLIAWELGVGEAERELTISDLDDPRALAFVQEFEYRSIRSLNRRTAPKVQATLQQALYEGVGAAVLAKRLDRILEGRVATVQTIARTETHRAYGWAQFSSWRKSGVVRRKEVFCVLDDRVRPDHLEAHGEVADLNDAFTRGAAAGYLMKPFAPNCLLPDVQVQGRFTAGLRAQYVGPALEVITTNGHRLRVTPNHKVLTPAGFRPASALRKGDDVVCHSPKVEPPAGPRIHVDAKNGPASVQHAFRLVAETRFATMARVSDFDGDERFLQGEVDVVVPPSSFEDRAEVLRAESVRQFSGARSDVGLPGLPRSGTLHLGLQGVVGPAASQPSLLQLPGPPLADHPDPLGPLSLGLTTEGYPQLSEAGKKNVARVARAVAEMLQAFPGQVVVGKVVDVRDFHFEGHVYDLQSPEGYYFAGGVAVSNCRCDVLPVVDSSGEEDAARDRERGEAHAEELGLRRSGTHRRLRSMEDAHAAGLVQAWRRGFKRIREAAMHDESPFA